MVTKRTDSEIVLRIEYLDGKITELKKQGG
jgi:hypothetical protein